MNGIQQRKLGTVVQKIAANGGTNLSGGLMHGIDVIMREPNAGRQRKLILVSDGLANQGITDPYAIGQMAEGAVNNAFSISTVGVGYDFNEILMTNIADQGAGQYYFLENPQAFAQVFEKELRSSRSVAASGLEIRVPLEKGLRLLHAGGYPVTAEDGHAVIRMGDLLSAQQRKIFLTFNVPTDKEQKLVIGPFKTRYVYTGCKHLIDSGQKITIACVRDQVAVMSSIDKVVWGEQVIQEDFNRLKGEVADAIRCGRKDKADELISEYEYQQRSLNSVVGSKRVIENLEGDVPNLRKSVEEAFAGSPSVAEQKQKEKAKALQYESYKVLRDKK
jgi:Ca-activated chloride channel family protein